METKQLKRLPVGIQTFDKLIQGGYLYIDKTKYIHKMVNASNYIFLSRPRRFGKSLLVSTLQSYFEGRKELFKGLAIEQIEKEWTEYPVLRFDMSTAKHSNKEELELELSRKLTAYETVYGKGYDDEVKPNQRLQGLIERAYKQTGKQVVVLIDEYDAPLLDVVHEDEQLPALRQVMRNFYSPLKNCDPYLKFVFLTGITKLSMMTSGCTRNRSSELGSSSLAQKFSQLSIFSELNNLKNISMLPEFAAICGITVEEMQTQMADYIDVFAETHEISHDEAVALLKKKYDGYHFTWPSPDIFNPFSLLNAMQDRRLDSYWFASGTPTYLIEMLRKFDVLPSDIGSMEALSEEFDAPTEGMSTIIPLLYQSGYLTIKGLERESHLYTLGVPNSEVRIGLMNSLLPVYAQRTSGRGMTMVAKMSVLLRKGDLDGALELLRQYLLTVPYCDHASSEGHYQQMLYIIFSLLAQYENIDVEVRTPTGRVDMVMRTDKALYLFELKTNKSAEVAMKQIDLKDYPSRFALCGLPVIKVGINFDAEKRTISDWEIESSEPMV